MPRYFFNVKDGRTSLDQEGTELGSIDDARDQAILTSGEMLRDRGAKFWTGEEWCMWVTDEIGENVCTLKFVAE